MYQFFDRDANEYATFTFHGPCMSTLAQHKSVTCEECVTCLGSFLSQLPNRLILEYNKGLMKVVVEPAGEERVSEKS